MKTIGMVGGMSWESTALYYRTMNREVARRLGGLHSAQIHLISLDFECIASRQRMDDWGGMRDILADAARRLERSGADMVLICTNTMHKVAPEVQCQIGIPLLHIGDVTAGAIRRDGLNTVGLLGTRFTMEHDFYVQRLEAHGVHCLVPDAADRHEVHRIIFDELCRGRVEVESSARLRMIAARLVERGAQGIVLGCTELTMAMGQADLAVPVFDTTELHALAAVDFAFQAGTEKPSAVALRT